MSNFFIYTNASYTWKIIFFSGAEIAPCSSNTFYRSNQALSLSYLASLVFISSRASATMRPIFRKPSKSCSLRIIMKTTVLPRIYILSDCIMFIFVLLLACGMQVDSSHKEYMTIVISMS